MGILNSVGRFFSNLLGLGGDATRPQSLELAPNSMPEAPPNPTQVSTCCGPTSCGCQTEKEKAIALHMQAPPEGVIVTGSNHEIKSIGAETGRLSSTEPNVSHPQDLKKRKAATRKKVMAPTPENPNKR